MRADFSWAGMPTLRLGKHYLFYRSILTLAHNFGLLPQASRNFETLAVETFAEAGDHHFFLGRAGVDKFAVTQIDTDMGDFSRLLFGGVEKDQVACFEFAPLYLFAYLCLHR